MKQVLISFILIILCIGIIGNVNAQNVPDWVKNTAGWWADDSISENEFVTAIEFLINDNIISVSPIENKCNSVSYTHLTLPTKA